MKTTFVVRSMRALRNRGNAGFLSRAAVIALFVCSALTLILSGTLSAFFRFEVPAKFSQRTLTFEERVFYQRAIEEVYWRHRIWPAERTDSKPSFGEMVPAPQLERKVANYLRASGALENQWQRPITANQLQIEMDRMANHTKQPEASTPRSAAAVNVISAAAE